MTPVHLHPCITTHNPRPLVSIDETSSAIIHQILACRASLLSYQHLTLDRTNYAMGLNSAENPITEDYLFSQPRPLSLTPPPGGGASVSHAVNSRSRWVRAKQLRLVLIMWLSCRRWCAVFAKGPRAHSKYRLKLETQYGSVCHASRNMSSLITNIFS